MSTRIEGIIDRLAGAESFDDIRWILTYPMVNYCNSIVDDKIKDNVEAQGRAGIPAKVVRSNVKCCEWCRELEGEYTYPDIPPEVWARHENCTCIIEYTPAGGSRTDRLGGSGKAWYKLDADTYKQMREYNLNKETPTPQERIQASKR